VKGVGVRSLLIAPLAFALASCGAGGAGMGNPPTNVVDVEATGGFAFAPAHVTVGIGTTVRWTNKGAVPHTVTSGASSRPADGPGALLDRQLPSGATVELTFTRAGDWPYFCRYHEGMGMVGLVTVTPDGGEEPDALTMVASLRKAPGTERPGQRWAGQGMRAEIAATPIQTGR
jgi:plastocyanin